MSYTATIFMIMGLNMVLALSVYMTFMVGQFSLAQVGFWALGAYGTAMLTAQFGWPLVPALVASGIGCGLLGIAVGYPCLRIRGIYLALATLGFTEMVKVFFMNFTFKRLVEGREIGPEGAVGFRNIPVLSDVYDVYAFVLLLVVFFAWLSRSRLGLSLAAIREDEITAESIGIRTVACKVGMFAGASLIAGVGGGLYASSISYITAVDFGFHLTMFAILYVALGGTQHFLGPIFGAALLTALPEYIRFLHEYRMIVYGVLVIVIMIWRPKGLIDEYVVAAVARPFRRLWPAGRHTAQPGP